MVCGEEDGDCTEVRKDSPRSALSPFLHIFSFCLNLSLYLIFFVIYPLAFCLIPLSPTHASSHLHQVEVDSDGTVSLSSIATQFTGNIITHHTVLNLVFFFTKLSTNGISQKFTFPTILQFCKFHTFLYIRLLLPVHTGLS